MDREELKSGSAILVVEDEAFVRVWAAVLLEENGFSVIEAVAALKVLEAPPGMKLLFTDVQMSGSLNGMELARDVHARWPHILLVITSGRERPTPTEIPITAITVARHQTIQLIIVNAPLKTYRLPNVTSS
jgi:two-component system, response regulator PdtaR